MAQFINKAGQPQTITTEVIRNIRKCIITDYEKDAYNRLSDKYKSDYDLKSWLDYQVIGRMFMTGIKDNSTWSEFYERFYPMCVQISNQIIKDIEEARLIVAEQFEMFRFRRMYNSDDKIQRQYEELRRLQKLYDNNGDQDLEKEIEEAKILLEKFVKEEEDRKIEDLESYNGLTYDQIYEVEQKLFQKSQEEQSWFKNDKPIAGYIIHSVRNLSIISFNKRKNSLVIPSSRLQKSGSDDEMTEDEILGIATANDLGSNIYDMALNDEFESSIFGEEFLDEQDGEMVYADKLLALSQESMIKRAIELIDVCGDNRDVLHDFLILDMPQKDIMVKRGFKTVGAIKSRVSRSKMKMRDQLLDEQESQLLREGIKDNGIIKTFYKDMLYTLKESVEIRNRQFNGEHAKFLPNGFKYYSCYYHNNQKHGSFVEYYHNGVIKTTGQYDNGKKIGMWKSGNDNNVLEESCFYHPDGSYDYTVYNEYGEVHWTGSINKDGKETNYRVVNGLVQQYYPNGAIKITGTMKNDRKVGEWKTFYPNGTVSEIEIYKDNVCEYYSYDTDGTLLESGVATM